MIGPRAAQQYAAAERELLHDASTPRPAYNVTIEDLTFTITIGGWDTRPAAGDSMSGGWALNLTAIGATGNGYEEHRIVAVTHTSQQVVTSAAPDRYVLSLAELFRRMGR